MIKDSKNFETRWAKGRKMENLRDTLFSYAALMMDVGYHKYGTSRYRRCFNLASALETKIVNKWGKND